GAARNPIFRSFSRSRLLAGDHQIDCFVSDQPSPDDWLRRRALANQASGASRTYVVCEVKKVGCHAFAWGAIAQATVPGRFRRTQRKCKKTNDWPNGSFHHTFVGRRPIATGWKPCPTS